MSAAGRPRLEVGATGEAWTTALSDGRWQARVWVRDRDGRRRQVTGTGRTKGAARRQLERNLSKRLPAGHTGVNPAMTIAELAAYWLDMREARSAVPTEQTTSSPRGRPVSPQTLRAYSKEIRHFIVPNLGALRIGDITVGLLDRLLLEAEDLGRSTSQARSVLHQMFGLAVSHGAIASNPLSHVLAEVRNRAEVRALDPYGVQLARATLLAHLHEVLYDNKGQRKGGRRRSRNPYEFFEVAIATGGRVGEILAARWGDVDLQGDTPTLHLCGTLVEPDSHYVTQLTRQPTTKGRSNRRLIIPDHLAAMLEERQQRSRWNAPDDPVFASERGTWIWPSNVRTSLRTALATEPGLAGVTPHTFRRSVGTLLVHERGLDVARDVLGHSDPSVTFQHYTARRPLAPDVRETLSPFYPLSQS